MGKKKELIGEVVSTYMKTDVIKIERIVHHPLYLKSIRMSTKLYAHDEKIQEK